MITSDTNFRGNFDSIEAVWEAIPYGGVEGDYLNIQGVKYRWNKYLAMWENAEVVTETPARETVTFDEDVNMQNNLTVAGVLRAKKFVVDNLPTGIEDVEITESAVSGGNNVITFTYTNGESQTFNVKNGEAGKTMGAFGYASSTASQSTWDTAKNYLVPTATEGEFDVYTYEGDAWYQVDTFQVDVAGTADAVEYDDTTTQLGADNVQDALNEMVDNTNVFSEIDFIAETGTELSYFISGGTGNWAASSASYPYYCRILRIDTNSRYRITAKDNGPVHYALLTNNVPNVGTQATDWNNGIPKTILEGESITINSGEYTYLYCRNSTSGSVYYYPKKVEKKRSVGERFDECFDDIAKLNDSVITEPIRIGYPSMVKNKAIVSPTTHNWRADNDTDYWHYYFETTPDMKTISIQGNGSATSYITFVKTYNYEGTPTGTPDYCQGYSAPIGFPSASTPYSKVLNIPDDCKYVIINDRYLGGVQLPTAVYVCHDLKGVVVYKDTTVSTFNIPMEVGYISSNTGGNSPYSKDATADNGYAYVSTDGKFHYWRNVGMIEVSNGDYTLTFDKGDTCIINYYDALRELINRNVVDIVNNSISVTVHDARYIRIEVYTKSETFEQDYALEPMYEPKVSVSGIFPNGFKIAKLKKQFPLEADNIVIPVWIENPFASIEKTQQMQDTGEWHIDFGRISLPSNYDPDGEPVRLIIYSHGGSARYNPVFENTEGIYYVGAGQWEKTIHIDPALFLAEGYAVMDMDACFCIFNTKDIDGVRVQGGKQVANCYKSAYDFVIRNYNIKTDGVLLGGISFGGNRSLQLIAWSNIPILAAALHSPYVGEHKLWYVSHRKTLARHAGFTDCDEVTTGYLDAEQLEIMEENYPKLLRTSPMLAMCHPSKEEFFATKTIDIGGQPVEVSLLNGYKNFGIYVVSTWAAHIPVPIKMWGGTADTTAQIDEHAEILYNVGINGGSDIVLRIVNGAKHIPTLGSDIITIPTYVTKYGETLTNVSMIYAETIRYWRRYEQD